jgi:SAM-dependent methyltransferase
LVSERLAQSFGGSAVEYERVRPDWPPAAVDRAVPLLGLGLDADVVDLAAGTGKLTRLLAERFDHVVAVEPDDRMRRAAGSVLLWNNWWETEPAIPEEATALLREPYERSGRAFRDDVYAWRGAVDESPFEPPREEQLAHEVVAPAEDLTALYCSTSSIASLNEAKRSWLLRRLRGLLTGDYRLPIEIGLVWTRLR